MRRGWLREPLVHFLAAGLLLFGVYRLWGPSPDPDPRVVVVDRAALLTFLQYRSPAFDAEGAAARLDALPDAERESLIRDYVREEALYREALALGLDRDDYTIRRRLVQAVDFVAQAAAAETPEPGDAEVRAWFEAHRADYRLAPRATFTHVFFDAARRGPEAARSEAEALLRRLDAGALPHAEAPHQGDRFPYHRSYVERTPDEVASHFGAELSARLFVLDPDPSRWRGPFASPHGAHLVLLTARSEAREAELAEIEARVREDARQARLRAAREEAVDAIVSGYEVRIALERDGGAGR